MEIRTCESRDVAAICAIYNHYISRTTISFEEAPVSLAAMQARIEAIQQHYPWLVCCDNGDVVGFAYAARWKERSAYCHTAESTVYVKKDAVGNGYGHALYTQLLDALACMDIHVVVACIALPNDASVRLHERCGFCKVAHFSQVGYKFGQWQDVGYWQRTLPEENRSFF